MSIGEYVIAAFLFLMLITFFGVFIWYQVKRIKQGKYSRNKKF